MAKPSRRRRRALKTFGGAGSAGMVAMWRSEKAGGGAGMKHRNGESAGGVSAKISPRFFFFFAKKYPAVQ
jgi:hypothetical protein